MKTVGFARLVALLVLGLLVLGLIAVEISPLAGALGVLSLCVLVTLVVIDSPELGPMTYASILANRPIAVTRRQRDRINVELVPEVVRTLLTKMAWLVIVAWACLIIAVF